MNSDILSKPTFFVFVGLWFLMVYYTLVPWTLGLSLETNPVVDITPLTWIIVVFSMMNTILWFAIQIIYLFYAKEKLEKIQTSIVRKYKNHNTSEPLVSIIIPARNEETVIKRTVKNCLSQTYKNIEIIVVCHNCSDGTYAAAHVDDNRVKVFDYKTEKAGKGIANNFGVHQASGEYILVLDSDGILANDFIVNALPLFGKNIAAVQGKILASNSRYNLVTKLAGVEGYLCSIPFMTVRSMLDKRTPLGGTGCMIRKDKLLEVGGFRNALIDDFELSFRFYRHGYRILFAPLSVIYNENPPEIASLIRQRSRWIKGHFDLLRERVPERTDLLGIIYWLTPIFMLSGLLAVCLASFSVVHYILLGYFPYIFSTAPITLWLLLLGIHSVIQTIILIRDFGIKGGMKYVIQSGLLVIFTQYWQVTLIKAFFVKSWADTKTRHGFMSAYDISQVPLEQIPLNRYK